MMSVLSIIVGSVSNTLALGFGNQTMFAGATSLTLCINSILGTFLLKETLSRMDVLGIVISIVGSFFYLLNAKEKDADYTEKELFNLLFRPGGIMFLFLSFMSILGVYFFYRHVVSELQLAYAFMKSVVET
jgi:membrane protein insertase Oxa1/YidC/SpoIIIJ